MQTTRTHRRATERAKRQRLVWVLAAVAVAAALVGLAALGFGAWRTLGAGRQVATGQSATPTTSAAEVAVLPTAIEVPDLTGLTSTEAEVVAKAAGLKLAIRVEGSSVETTGSQKVRNQVPEAGSSAKPGDTIEIIVPPLGKPAPAAAPSKGSVPGDAGAGFTVVIDPGHQLNGDSSPEPIGPGASSTKPSVTSGATGVATGRPEHQVVLEISKKLAADLRAAGVNVVMTRETADVSLSNSQRAKIANDAKADLFIRVHADSIDESSRTGISTLVPGANQWTGPIRARSARAGRAVQSAVVKSTGAVDRGVVERTDMSGFNWSKVPAVIVETGFLSNPAEDRKLSSAAYQTKLASGMAAGVLAYLRSAR